MLTFTGVIAFWAAIGSVFIALDQWIKRKG